MVNWNFSIAVKVQKEYERDLWNVKLDLAKEHGLLSQISVFTNKVLTTIPALLVEAVGLITLNCSSVLCTDFPDLCTAIAESHERSGQRG